MIYCTCLLIDAQRHPHHHVCECKYDGDLVMLMIIIAFYTIVLQVLSRFIHEPIPLQGTSPHLT